MNITSIPWWKRLFTGSIKARIVVYAVTALVIGLVYSCCMIYILMEAEAQLMTSAMKSMLMETIEDDLANGKPPDLDSFSHLYIERDANNDIPERFRNLPDGYSEYTQHVSNFVLHEGAKAMADRHACFIVSRKIFSNICFLCNCHNYLFSLT